MPSLVSPITFETKPGPFEVFIHTFELPRSSLLSFGFTKHNCLKIVWNKLGPIGALQGKKLKGGKKTPRWLSLSAFQVAWIHHFENQLGPLRAPQDFKSRSSPHLVKVRGSLFPKYLQMIFSETKLVPIGARQAKRKLIKARKILSWPCLCPTSPNVSWHFWADLKVTSSSSKHCWIYFWNKTWALWSSPSLNILMSYLLSCFCCTHSCIRHFQVNFLKHFWNGSPL